MKQVEYFKINSIEELKKAYEMFEDKWRITLETEIYLFNKGYRYVISNSIGVYLGDYILNGFTEIKSPINNINNLNKLI